MPVFVSRCNRPLRRFGGAFVGASRDAWATLSSAASSGWRPRSQLTVALGSSSRRIAASFASPPSLGFVATMRSRGVPSYLRRRRGYAAETGRGDAAATTWIVRGDGVVPVRERSAPTELGETKIFDHFLQRRTASGVPSKDTAKGKISARPPVRVERFRRPAEASREAAQRLGVSVERTEDERPGRDRGF